MVAICRLIYNLIAVYTFQVQHVKWSYSSVKIIKNYTLQQYNHICFNCITLNQHYVPMNKILRKTVLFFK